MIGASGLKQLQTTSGLKQLPHFRCLTGFYSFSGKFGVLCFLVTPVLRFALLPYYQQNLVNF